ncbi:RTA1-domain-containing protein [Lentithecium fluviatile CBS 122367]|uniref:RTA1-domain-containing protein n=1 Tax=Lentithecium fluviatile CBS 122367 TaxID=1168545 RepID=A0A6G1J325_9PLEO|nr:RTA1-domain-containing protein [Lentithecium fluviatile CBS 122367]
MSPPPQIEVPENCTAVSFDCPVEGTIYGYYPSLGWNAFFAGFFGLCCLLQLIFGIRYKTWTYMIGVGLGCAAECGGYVGRIMMHNNPYDDLGFQIQVVLLIFAPAFLAAGIYLILKHAVILFGEEWSRIRPAWYTYIFIACDVSSLVLQSAGGAIAATADDDKKTSDMGTNIMIAGIIWQVVVLVIFGALVAEYCYRTYTRRTQLTHSALTIWSSRRFRVFIGAVVIAYITIFIRCVYRIPELLGGWGGELMRVESEFIAFEGWMIVLCVMAQTVCHPGIFFPVMGGAAGKRMANRKLASSEESDVEMLDRA